MTETEVGPVWDDFRERAYDLLTDWLEEIWTDIVTDSVADFGRLPRLRATLEHAQLYWHLPINPGEPASASEIGRRIRPLEEPIVLRFLDNII